MAGRQVELLLPYRESVILELKRDEAQERTIVKIEVPGAVFPERIHQFETRGGIKFEGTIEMDGETTTHRQAMVLVKDDTELKKQEVTIVKIRTPGPVFQERIHQIDRGIKFQGMVDMDGKTTTHRQVQATVLVTDCSGTRGGMVDMDGETTTHRQPQATVTDDSGTRGGIVDSVLVTVNSGLKGEEGQQLTIVNIHAPGAVFPEIIHQLHTRECIKFQGIVGMDGNTTTHRQATLVVRDGTVWSCRCCTDMGVPTPPFLSSTEGMAVRFSESDPHKIEATVLTIVKRPTLSEVVLELTSLPPYSACIGERIILRSGLHAWEATVTYFADQNTLPDVTFLENKICIHVLDEHAPQGPKLLPHSHTTIFVRPAQGPPSNWTFGHVGKGSKKKRKNEGIESNKEKIKIAINAGYKDIGRALTRVALDSDDVDLVAINDPSIADQVSCMFRDSKCDFEVKSRNPDILSFGRKEVNFFQRSDSSAVPWYMSGTKIVVTSSKSSQYDEDYCKAYAAKYSQDLNDKLSGPLEKMLAKCKPFSTTPNNSKFPILNIKPISPRDAKAVSNFFPLWKGEEAVSRVRFQGVDMIFVLGRYPDYNTLPTRTLPSPNLPQLLRWSFHMLSQTPAGLCVVQISE